MQIDGRFWLTKEGQSFLGAGRIELLEHIDKIGSIHAAAKEMKMSYKAAWERINGMNLLADHPLIERTTGGKGGGGTVFLKRAMIPNDLPVSSAVLFSPPVREISSPQRF